MAGKKSAIYGGAVLDSHKSLGAPMVIEPEVLASALDRAGFAPERLDGIIRTLIDNADSGSKLLQEYTPMLQGIMRRLRTELDAMLATMAVTPPVSEDGKAPTGMGDGVIIMLELAGKVSVVLERLNKMTLHAVKSKDDAVRLRTFLATGDDERATLENLGETALRRIVTDAAQGWIKVESGNGGG